MLVFLIILTACGVENKALTEQQVTNFYQMNQELLNNAAQEYKIVVKPNFEEAYIYLFFSDGNLNINDPVNKINYTTERESYKYCTDTLFAMNQYMLDIGFVQNGKDYTVSIFKYRVTQDFTADGSNKETVAFEFQDINNEKGYLLLYTTEALSNEDFIKIDENWYVHIWEQV